MRDRVRFGRGGGAVTQADFPLPGDLPVPLDDGAADHLTGMFLPNLELRATSGQTVRLSALLGPRAVLYLYPMTGRPGTPLPEGWDQIPGARGCTPESCGFRDHHAAFASTGAHVYGLSSQDTTYQAEAVERLQLPFSILSDPGLELAAALSLPTFDAGTGPLYKRLTMVIADGRIEHVFYPIFPPDGHAAEVLDWLGSHPVA
jgi:peroxiredoxin